jgi:hypothetical protein
MLEDDDLVYLHTEQGLIARWREFCLFRVLRVKQIHWRVARLFARGTVSLVQSMELRCVASIPGNENNDF